MGSTTNETFVGSKRKVGESSHPSDIPRSMRRSYSTQHEDPSANIAPSLYKFLATKQKSIKDLLKGGAIKEIMGHLISKIFIYESIAPHKTSSHHFKNMIFGAQ